jgi:hypothetical protein
MVMPPATGGPSAAWPADLNSGMGVVQETLKKERTLV